MDYVTLDDVKDLLGSTAAKMVTPVRVTPDTAKAYYDSLRDMSYETLKAALTYCVENERGEFFPAISRIRDAARILMATALGIPSPAEAWGMVLSAKTRIEPVWCEEGARIRDLAISGTEYSANVLLSKQHDSECDICTAGSWALVYAHPAVAMTVRMIGGPDAIHTGMPTADRARFLEAFSEIVEREVRNATQSPAIKVFIENTKARYEIEAPKAIAGLLEKWTNR